MISHKRDCKGEKEGERDKVNFNLMLRNLLARNIHLGGANSYGQMAYSAKHNKYCVFIMLPDIIDAFENMELLANEVTCTIIHVGEW